MNQDLSILHLVINASFVVQLVMALLLTVSVTSWAAIFRKFFALKRVKSQNEAFEREFWSGTSLNDLFDSASRNAAKTGPMERIFGSGMREFQKLRERRITDVGTLMDGARRAMRASFQREMDEVETNLSFLASVGSVSPYVGLFGTVWGIMHAFVGLAAIAPVPLWLASLALLVPSLGFTLAVGALAWVASLALIRHGVRPLLHINDEKTAHYVANMVTLSGIAAWIALLVVSAVILSMLIGSW